MCVDVSPFAVLFRGAARVQGATVLHHNCEILAKKTPFVPLHYFHTNIVHCQEAEVNLINIGDI